MGEEEKDKIGEGRERGVERETVMVWWWVNEICGWVAKVKVRVLIVCIP